MSSIRFVKVISLVLLLGSVVAVGDFCEMIYGDDIVLHRSYQDDGVQACCKAIRCSPGYHAVLCNANDPNTTSCQPCPINTYQPEYTDSVDMRYCDSKTDCLVSDRMVVVDDDSRVKDRKCLCNLEKGYCNSSRNRSIFCVEGDCPPGKQLNHDCSCSDCPIGYFKDVSGSGHCKRWRNCRVEGRRTSVEGSTTTDRVCSNSTYNSPSLNQITDNPVTEDQNGADYEQATDANNIDTSWKIAVITAVVIVLTVGLLILIAAFICRRYICQGQTPISDRFGALCKNICRKPAQNSPNQDQGSGDKLLPGPQTDPPDVIVDKENWRQQPLNGHVQCDNGGEESKKLLKKQLHSSEEDTNQRDRDSVTEAGKPTNNSPDPGSGDTLLRDHQTDPPDVVVDKENRRQQPLNECVHSDNGGEDSQNLLKKQLDSSEKDKYQHDGNSVTETDKSVPMSPNESQSQVLLTECPKDPSNVGVDREIQRQNGNETLLNNNGQDVQNSRQDLSETHPKVLYKREEDQAAEKADEDPCSLMTKRMKSNINSHRVDLVEDLYISEKLLALLRVNGTIDGSMEGDIRKEQTRAEKVSRLLDILVKRPVTSYKTFIFALMYTEQRHLAERIDAELTKRIDEMLAKEYKEHSHIDPQKLVLSFGNLNVVHER